jgi:predicted DCC family thiol-disulfide oxidoreductase YuxK
MVKAQPDRQAEQQPGQSQAPRQQITVFYDAACPGCVKDRRWYERLAGHTGRDVHWLDISGQDAYLQSLGIDPHKALTELHIQLGDGRILSELDAYIVLLRRVWLLTPLAWLISLPLIRPWLARVYHHRVLKRLRDSGRL